MKNYKVLLILLIFISGCFFKVISVSASSTTTNYTKLSENAKKILSNNKNECNVSLIVEYKYDSDTQNKINIAKSTLDASMTSDLNHDQNALRIYRNKIKKINKDYQKEISKTLNINYNNIEYSIYTPFVFINTDENNINYLLINNNIKYIGVADNTIKYVPDSIPSGYNLAGISYDYLNTTNIAQVKQQYNVDGSGIFIGINDIEGGVDTNNVELHNFLSLQEGANEK